MASRRDYYYRQLVTEAELDAGFEALEQADRYMMADFGLIGVVSGAVVTQHSPTPNLTVDVTGNAAIYDQAGQRIAIPSLQVIDMSVDSNNVSTAVTTPGNEKWVGLWAKFTRSLSDPRVDGNSNTVYFVRDESVMFVKTQGAEAVIGAASRPALMADAILLADVQRTQGQTQILNANISTSRRQDAFVISAGAFSVRAGTPEESDLAILTALNTHVTAPSGAHAAAAIDYAGGPSWAGGTSPTNPATTAELQLDKIITDLAATTSNASGFDRLGCASIVGTSSTISAGTGFSVLTALKSAANIDLGARTTWLGGRTNPAATLFAGIDKIITDLGLTTTSDDGMERIGGQAVAGSPTSLSAGSARSQVDELLVAVNARARINSTETITGAWSFTQAVTGSNGFTASGGSVTVNSGNITATAGNIAATAGNISAGGTILATGDAGGARLRSAASEVSLAGSQGSIPATTGTYVFSASGIPLVTFTLGLPSVSSGNPIIFVRGKSLPGSSKVHFVNQADLGSTTNSYEVWDGGVNTGPITVAFQWVGGRWHVMSKSGAGLTGGTGTFAT